MLKSIPFLFSSLALIGGLSAEVLHVGGPTADYAQINSAVSAAQDGDVILVWSGSYGGFSIFQKSLTLLPAVAGSQINFGPVSIHSLQVDDHVQVALGGNWGGRLAILDCAGSVRVSGLYTNQSSGGAGSVVNCDNVVLEDCKFMATGTGWGSSGLKVEDSTVAIYATAAAGQHGRSDPSLDGTAGGHGMQRSGSGIVFLSRAQFSGGRGGNGSLAGGLLGGFGGDGGDGVRSPGPSNVLYQHCVLSGASGGVAYNGNGAPGQPMNVGTLIPGFARTMEASSLVFDNAEIGLVFRGLPGDTVAYAVSEMTEYLMGSHVGPQLIGNPQWIPAGSIPWSGVLHVTHPVSGLPMLTHTVQHFQARISAAGIDYLTNPVWTAVLGRGLDHCAIPDTRLGREYCAPNQANSTGGSSRLWALGSHCASNNEVSLVASSLPQSQFGYVLNSPGQDFVTNPGGSAGNLCLGGGHPIGRHNSATDIRNSGLNGSFLLDLDLNQIPSSPTSVTITAGLAWNFQVWHRDVTGSNFTNALEIVFH